jgi:hypothetical protein
MAEASHPEGELAQSDAPLTLNLQVVSPSVGVNGPLSFLGIPATTTVGQLKERIRDTVTARPTADQQRLIHRGRLLSRDTDTLQDVFGVETVQYSPQSENLFSILILEIY